MLNLKIYERVKKIPIDRIKPFISRDRDPAIRKKLKTSIKEYGLIMPVTVIEKKNGKYELVKGEGRVIAHKDLSLSKIKAFVFAESELSEKEIIQNWLVENEVREKMSDIDKVRLMKVEYEITKSISEIARKFKMRPGTVKQYLKTLDEADEEVLDMVEKNKITWTKTKEITAGSKDKSTQRAIAKVVAEDKLSSKDTRTVIKAAQNLKKKKIQVKIGRAHV